MRSGAWDTLGLLCGERPSGDARWADRSIHLEPERDLG